MVETMMSSADGEKRRTDTYLFRRQGWRRCGRCAASVRRLLHCCLPSFVRQLNARDRRWLTRTNNTRDSTSVSHVEDSERDRARAFIYLFYSGGAARGTEQTRGLLRRKRCSEASRVQCSRTAECFIATKEIVKCYTAACVALDRGVTNRGHTGTERGQARRDHHSLPVRRRAGSHQASTYQLPPPLPTADAVLSCSHQCCLSRRSDRELLFCVLVCSSHRIEASSP
jgi:hypothetical protein